MYGRVGQTKSGKDCSVLLFFISAEFTLLCRILHVQYIVSFDDLPESPQTIGLTAEKTSNHVAQNCLARGVLMVLQFSSHSLVCEAMNDEPLTTTVTQTMP